ncbi:hypothetical protein BDV10DRAFT_128510 [Aspergillus recurvatus]
MEPFPRHRLDCSANFLSFSRPRPRNAQHEKIGARMQLGAHHSLEVLTQGSMELRPSAANGIEERKAELRAGAEGITASSSDQRYVILRTTVGLGRQV